MHDPLRGPGTRVFWILFFIFFLFFLGPDEFPGFFAPNLQYLRLRKSRHDNLCNKNQFFRENVVVIAFSELRPGSNERYENSTFYGPFRGWR